MKEKAPREPHPYEQNYPEKGPKVRASARQLWMLNNHDGFLTRALDDSKNGRFITADAAHVWCNWISKNKPTNDPNL